LGQENMNTDMARTSWLLSMTLAFMAVGCASDTRGIAQRYEIRMAVVAPDIDGHLASMEWSAAEEAIPVQLTADAGAEQTSIRVLYDRDSLYIAVHCTDSRITERADAFWKNDSVRANIVVGAAEAENSFRLGFSVVPQGLVSARFHKGPTPLMEDIRDFTQPLDPSLYNARCFVGKGEWSTELRISWAAIRPLGAPPDEFHIFIERRNVNGDKVEVADWPYDKKIVFEFADSSEKKAAPTPPSSVRR